MKKSLQISEEEKRTILIKYNLLEDSKKEPKIKSISCLKDDPNGATASDCTIVYKNGNKFEGRLKNGFPELGKFTFSDGHFYEGSFAGTTSHSKIHYSGDAMDANRRRVVNTEDLLLYHEENYDPEEVIDPTDNEEIEQTNTDGDKVVYDEKEKKVIIPASIKSKWKGCGTQDKDFYFDGTMGSTDLGYLLEPPEMGNAKYEGTLELEEVLFGKTIKFTGCFDKYNMIYGEESGGRGNFEGYYYTEDVSKKFFSGDVGKANKFMYGKLSNNYDYEFYNAVWTYTGFFVNGKIDGTSSEIPAGFDETKFGSILFGDNNRYDGDFKGGKIEGKGIFYFSDGMKLEGDFKTEEAEEITMSVITNGGKYISDIFEYNRNYKEPEKKPEEDKELKTIGAVKTSTFNGKTFFKFQVKNQKTGSDKDFKNLLGKVFIRITNKSDRKIFFETTSDEFGSFKIDNVPFGTYKILCVLGNKRNGFLFRKKDFIIDKGNEKVSIFLKPVRNTLNSINNEIKRYEKSTKKNADGKRIDYSGDEIMDFFSMTNDEMKEYLKNSIKTETSTGNWVSDMVAGRFEKKYGKVTTKEACLREFKDYADIIRKIQNGEINLEILKTPGNNLQPTKNYLKDCLKTYGNQITDKEDVKIVMNPPGEAYGFGVRLENNNKQNIYKDMGLSRTINKVVTEHADKKKSLIQESRIINNRLRTITESFNLNRKSERRLAFNELRNEKIKLISLGYDRNIVKESFIEVMKSLFGSSGQDPVSDFKKGLSEKLSTPIDLKVIANELDAAIIEEAFKTENPKDLILETIIEKIKEKIDPQIDVVFQNINKKMDDFRNAVGGLQV